VLLEVDRDVVNLVCKSPRLILFGLLTLMRTRRIPLDFHVCSTSTVLVIFFGMFVTVSANHLVCTPIDVFLVDVVAAPSEISLRLPFLEVPKSKSESNISSPPIQDVFLVDIVAE
jgi:hypothetical protein